MKVRNMESSVKLLPVKELLGMNFYIPEYQRGYRWGKQQAVDLLEDISAFANKISDDNDEIYCIQPLVVSKRESDEVILKKCKKEDATLEDIKKAIKGSWTVVDGQQRLTTIYILLRCLNEDKCYEIEYGTRNESKDFLTKINSDSDNSFGNNIDFYYMKEVHSAITGWLQNKSDSKNNLRAVLLNKVNFIWYDISGEDEIAVFTRLNIGKIPLTDSELIKALFLNRTNFGSKLNVEDKWLEIKQHDIASEWDQIENALQNDEFWAFLHDVNYSRPTRIDFILDLIKSNDKCELYEKEDHEGPKSRQNNEEAKSHNKVLNEKIGNDEHATFRYFNEAFLSRREIDSDEWLDDLWNKVKDYYQVFNEWYQDYRLYHYIGYLTTINGENFNISSLIEEWNNRTKSDFVQYIKSEIVKSLEPKKTKETKNWIKELPDYKFEEGSSVSKTETVGILLLHNIETIIQQNEKLVAESKYNLPNFSKFPFHLYKREKWQVEHIRPNAGDDFNKKDSDKLYLSLAQPYVNKQIETKIKKYLDPAKNESENFNDILAEIWENGGALPEEDKNKIFNFVLLDESTNKEYGNQIFPVKRAFIVNKEKGLKVRYSYEKGELVERESTREIAFVPPCTKNVFSKFYTTAPSTMVNWNTEDAEAYWKDMCDKLKFYFDKLKVKKDDKQ